MVSCRRAQPRGRRVDVGGPLVALPLIDALAVELADYHLWHATRVDLLRRLHRIEESIASYRRAHALAVQKAERRFIQRRLRELESDPQLEE